MRERRRYFLLLAAWCLRLRFAVPWLVGRWEEAAMEEIAKEETASKAS